MKNLLFAFFFLATIAATAQPCVGGMAGIYPAVLSVQVRGGPDVAGSGRIQEYGREIAVLS